MRSRRKERSGSVCKRRSHALASVLTEEVAVGWRARSSRNCVRPTRTAGYVCSPPRTAAAQTNTPEPETERRYDDPADGTRQVGVPHPTFDSFDLQNTFPVGQV